MPFLLYCISEADISLPPIRRGVAGTPVLRLEELDLALFCSENDNPDAWIHLPLSATALEFHRVLQAILGVGAIIPFRFPTIMGSREEASAHIRERHDQYRNVLRSFKSSVQMEITISYEDRTENEPVSGTEYLRGRAQRKNLIERFVSELQAAGGEYVRDWRLRATPQLVRCFGLIERASTASFTDRMQSLQVPASLGVRVSGPWAVTEFVELK